MKLIGLLKDLIFCVINERHGLGSLGSLGRLGDGLLFGDWSIGYGQRKISYGND